MEVTLFNLFSLFFKIGLQLVGGGYVIIPLLKHSMVDQKKWISEKELLDNYSISQCLPGLLAANIAILVGYKKRSYLGAIAALSGIIMPSFLIILLIASLLITQSESTLLQNAFWGVRMSVLVLIFLATKELLITGIKSKFAIFLYLAILLIMVVSNVSPVLLIIVSGIIGLLYKKYVKREI